MTSLQHDPDWGSHLQIVFSVLVAVSFAQALNVLGQEHFRVYQLLLIGTVFYVVLDCWYALHLELNHLHERGTTSWRSVDVWLYMVSLIAYSCLPFLYLAHTAATSHFRPPEFLMANLAAVCLLDAVRRNRASLADDKTGASGDSSDWHIKNDYLIFTGYGYFVALTLGTALLANADHLSNNLRAGIVLAAWAIIRGIDYIVVDRFSKRNSRPGNTATEGSST